MMRQCVVLLFLIPVLPFHGDMICDWGQYGDDCNRTCPENCRINKVRNLTHCQKVSGKCSEGCRHGWYGDQCDYRCSKNCPDNVCNQETAHCTKPCNGKTTGDFCENLKESATEPNQEETQNEVTTTPVWTIIIISVLLLLLLLLLGIIIRTIVKRRRKHPARESQKDLERQQSNTESPNETDNLMEDWQRLIVKTAAYQEVRDKLQKHNLVVLTGGRGDGKTTIGRMLCWEYQQQGYNTVFYSREEDFQWNVFRATKPTLVVINDMGDDLVHSNLEHEIRTRTDATDVRVLIVRLKSEPQPGIAPTVNMTQIGRQHLARTKQEYSHMLQMKTNIPADTRHI